jgi:hypothetical protein
MTDDERETEAYSPSDAVTPENPYHLSRAARTILSAVSVVLVISMTVLFIAGVVRW